MSFAIFLIKYLLFELVSRLEKRALNCEQKSRQRFITGSCSFAKRLRSYWGSMYEIQMLDRFWGWQNLIKPNWVFLLVRPSTPRTFWKIRHRSIFMPRHLRYSCQKTIRILFIGRGPFQRSSTLFQLLRIPEFLIHNLGKFPSSTVLMSLDMLWCPIGLTRTWPLGYNLG